MTKYIITISFLLLSTYSFSQSNLASFEVKDDIGNTYTGYAEPKSELTDINSVVKSRIFIFPKIYLDKNSVKIRNQVGDVVTISNYSNFDELTGRIQLKLISNTPDNEILMQIISQINTGIQKPLPLKEKPVPPILTGNNSLDIQRQTTYNARLAEWNSSRLKALELVNGYQIVPVFPKKLELKLKINGVIITDEKLDDVTVSPESVFQLNIPFSKNLFNFRLLLEDEYVIEGSFNYLSSRFQSASAVQDMQTFVNYMAESFRKEIVKAKSSSSGFLFWKSSQRSISRYVEEESFKNLSSGTVSKYEYKLYDVEDANLISQVDNFLFPKVSITETINSHIQAAQEAMNKGDENMAKIHTDYANFLTQNMTSLADVNHINPLEALTALGKNDIASFLAKGVAFNESSSSGTFTFRKILSGNISESEIKKFNGLIFKSLFESHLITSVPFNKVISSSVLPPDLIEKFILVNGASFKLGEEVNFPGTNLNPNVGFNFSPETALNDNSLTKVADFWIGKYEVTQNEWESLMKYNNSTVKGVNLPVTNISWLEAIDYCNKLSLKYNLNPAYSINNEQVIIVENSNGFRLPSNAEWEFAAKGGTQTKKFYYSGSNNVEEVAWYQKNSTSQIQNVGRKMPNELGLYDMSGNVCEWTFTSESELPLQTSQIHSENSSIRRLTKGGEFRTYESRLTPWSGSCYFYNDKYGWIGFRVILPKNKN